MAGTVVADTLQAASTSTLVLKNGVASTPPTVQDSAGTEIGTFCRAWVNFNGTGTVAIRSSFNVTSITDNGVGRYVVNFTTAMPDANYASVIGFGDSSVTSSQTQIDTTTRTTTACGINGLNAGGTVFQDISIVTVSVFR